ncbi:OmpA family protein [bacterium]|nr:OmpA family protein [bacterium]
MRLVLSVLMLWSLVFASDKDGCKDHPLITRYPGSEITYCETQQYDEYKLALGKWVTDKFAKELDLGGHITRIQYVLASTKVSSIEVFKNYTDALAEAKFETLALGKAEGGPIDMAGHTWLIKALKNLPNAVQGELGNHGFPDRRRYLAAKYARAEGDVYVALHVTQRSESEVRVHLDVIEVEPVKSGLVKVDAAYLKSEIERTGRVALYGIYFDTDKSEIKPESADAMKAIAELLKQNSSWKLYVVGHTDMTGALDHNMQLSESRAKSVVAELTGKQGIAADRLSGYGVGPLSPVATNSSDEGKAKNRRVELVKRL